jgi:hypothetical protein
MRLELVIDRIAAVIDAIRADPRCSDFHTERSTRTLFRSVGDKGPIDVVRVTHPSTSTEFLIGSTTEGQRLNDLRPGPFRTQRVAKFEAEAPMWTESYRRYREEILNARALLFQKRGTLDPDLEAPFYGVWAVEEASLHRPGHDDFGEMRKDGRESYCLGTFASAGVHEIVQWLFDTITELNRPVSSRTPTSVDNELASLELWPDLQTEAAGSEDRMQEDAEVRASLTALDGQRLYAMFPRDKRGRLRPRLRVLLAPMVPGSDRERRQWVVAVGPARVGGKEISIRHEPLIAANQAHRFDVAPWCWRSQGGALSDSSTWGYTGADAESIGLLRGGHIEEGLRAAGLELDEGVTRLAKGLLIGLLNYDPTWPEVTRERLCLIAPWLLLGPGLTYAHNLLKRKVDGIRLFTLPGQPWAAKASVVLVPGRQPSLEVRWTGSNAQLARVLWERPAIPGVWT